MPYRDALDAAHERIRVLERSREPKETSWTAVALVIAIGAACVAATTLAVAERSDRRRTAVALTLATAQRDDCEADFERVTAAPPPPECTPPPVATTAHGTVLRVAVGASTAAPRLEAGDECTIVVLHEACLASIRCPAFRAERVATTCALQDGELDRVRPLGAGASLRYDRLEGVVVIAPSAADTFARASVLSRTPFDVPQR